MKNYGVFGCPKKDFFLTFSERIIIILECLDALKQCSPSTCKLKSFISGKFA